MSRIIEGLKWFAGAVLSLVIGVLTLRFLSGGGDSGGNDKEAERVDSEAEKADEEFDELEEKKSEPVEDESDESHEEFWKDKL